MTIRAVFLVVAMAAAASLLMSCESNDSVVPFHANSSNSSHDASLKLLTGKWIGTSASTQVPSTLSLSEADGEVSGVLKWPGDTRSVSGTHNDATVTLYIEGGDFWNMQYDGHSMLGVGHKYGGGTYDLSFTRN